MAAMNEAALKSMVKMIQVMLPYETDYEPKETSTQVIQEIFEVLRGLNPKVSEFEGFFNYILKGMDTHGDSGRVDRALMSVWAIINNSYPPYKLKEVDNEPDEDEPDPVDALYKQRDDN